MKICYLANSAIPSSTANSIAIVKLCEAFQNLKHQVLLITTNVSKKNKTISEFYNVKSNFKIKKIKYFKKFPLGISYYFFSIISIIKSLDFNPDLYITRNFFSCFILTILKKKVIIELHQDLKTESRIVKFLVKFTNYLNSKYVVKIITITNGVRDEYLKKKYIRKEKTLLLASGSSNQSYFNFRIKKKNFKIGYFGSLYKSRGFELILKLSKIDFENQYFLYGDVTQISKAKINNIPKNLKINNHIPYKKITKVLSSMDILVMPYTSSVTVAGDVSDITKYTSPLKLFDYLSSGKIIVCSEIEVLKEIIQHNKNAIFIKNFKNPYSWKNELLKLKYQQSKQLIISKNNYVLSKKFSLRQRANSILKSLN
jgi:glycosyltransferase involved in cell wall biosynthesis